MTLGAIRVTRLGDFSPDVLLFIGSLKKLPQNDNIFGYKFITFSPKKSFKNMFCTLALFGEATILATFQKIGQIFAKSSGHPGRNAPQPNATRHNNSHDTKLSTFDLITLSMTIKDATLSIISLDTVILSGTTLSERHVECLL